MTPKRLSNFGISILDGEVPVMHSQANTDECAYPALDWAYFALGFFCQRVIHLSDWFEEKYSFSMYSGVPLGTFRHDSEGQLIDVLFSRSLVKSNCVLWYSDTSLPDLGGNEDSDSRRFLFDQFDSNIEICNSGFYRSYCVEIDVNLLCINAILQSDHIYEVVTTSTNQKIDKVNNEFIDLHNQLSEEVESPESCYTAFLNLKGVVSQWIEDIKRGNVFADILLQHLYRWLSSPESKLYDPQLYNFINLLMKKCFSELIDKFKSRDANIIFGTFNKIIIETKRPDFEQAQNYVNFIFESIEKFEMFKYIKFSRSRTWKILLFKDRFNYAGFDEAQTQKKISCEWDLINHLPSKVGRIFKMLVAEFVDSVYEFNKQNSKKIMSHDGRDKTIQYKNISKPLPNKDEEDPYVGNYLSYTNNQQLDLIQEVSEADDIHFMRNKIETHFTQSLLSIIDEIELLKSNADHNYEDSITNPQNYSEEE